MSVDSINRELIRRATDSLACGGVIAYPTEGVWGLGCDPASESAVRRLLALKQRPMEKGLILVADRIERLSPFFTQLPSDKALRVSGRPITWVVEHGGTCPGWLSGGRDTLAIRLSEHPVICALCEAGQLPLVSTSANPAGRDPALSATQVADYFGDLIDVIVEGELGGENGASEIRDFRSGKVLREANW